MPLPRSVGIRRTAVPAALGAALLLFAAACSSSGSTSTAAGGGGATPATKECSNIPAGPINVYNIVPLTGPTATSGELITSIAGVAAAYFNAHSSICGHQIAVHNLDDKGDPATSLGIARQLVNNGDTIVMQDSFGAAEDLIHPYLMQHQVLIVNGNGAYSLYNAKQNPYSFSVGPSNQEYAEVMVNWAKSHGYTNIGILNDGSSFGNELTGDVLGDIKADGLKLVKVVTYSPTSVVLTTPVEQLRQAGAQTVFPDGFTDVLQIVQAIKQVGWSPHLVGWGNLAIFGVTQAQVPAGHGGLVRLPLHHGPADLDAAHAPDHRDAQGGGGEDRHQQPDLRRHRRVPPVPGAGPRDRDGQLAERAQDGGRA